MEKFKNFWKKIWETYYYLMVFFLIIILTLVFVFTLDIREFIVLETISVVFIPILAYFSRKAGSRYYERKKIQPSRSLYVTGMRKRKQKGTNIRVLTSMARRGGPPSPVIAMGDQELIDIMTGVSRLYDNELWFGKKHPQPIDEYLKDKASSKFDLMNDLKVILGGIQANNILVQDVKEDIVLFFEFPKENEFFFLLRVILKVSKENNFILESIFRKYQPFTFSARIFAFDDEDVKHKELRSESLESLYTINYSYALDFELLQKKTDLQKMLVQLAPSLELIYVNRKHVAVGFHDYTQITYILQLMKEMYNEFSEQKIGIRAVVEIECYACGAKLDENDIECSKCHAKRPRCSVCLLDLHPSEKEKVVQTPCCGVYGHHNHLVMWIEKTHKCPNCKTNQVRWLEKLRVTG